MLVPPQNFGVVEDGVYRCGKVGAINIPFLALLQLRLVVYMDAEKPPRALRTYFNDNNVDLVHLSGLERHDKGSSDAEGRLRAPRFRHEDRWMVIPRATLLRALSLLVNRTMFNVLLVDPSETAVGVLRKAQKWSYASIICEYRLYAGAKSNYECEVFVDLVEVYLLETLPEPPAVQHDSETEEADATATPPTAGLDDEIAGLPQIPLTLLRMVEMRKAEHTKTQRPERPQMARSQSIVATLASTGPPLPHGSRTPYAMYRPAVQDRFPHVEALVVELPPEDDLPAWFVRQREVYEKIVAGGQSGQGL